MIIQLYHAVCDKCGHVGDGHEGESDVDAEMEHDGWTKDTDVGDVCPDCAEEQ